MAEPAALIHATQLARPFHTKGWVYEEKYNGWRMLAVKEPGGVRLVSWNGRDHTKRFNAIAEALAALKPKTLTLDGAKDPEPPYAAGLTLKWIKVKQPKYRGEERGF
jgi:ATP-dependent DNA ligase